MKKLSIALLSSLSMCCFITTVFAETTYQSCKAACHANGSVSLDATCESRACGPTAGIDLGAECKTPWCAKNKLNALQDGNEKYSTEWYQ